MVLRLLAIERVGHVPRARLGEGDGGARDERDPLVGGAVEHVELDARREDGLRVAASEPGEGPPGVEQPGIEEVGADAPGLELELPETKRVALEGEVDEPPRRVVRRRTVSASHRLRTSGGPRRGSAR